VPTTDERDHHVAQDRLLPDDDLPEFVFDPAGVRSELATFIGSAGAGCSCG